MAQEITFFQVLRMLLVLGVILVAVYFVTKFVAGKSMGRGLSFRPKPSGDKLPNVLYRYAVDKESTLLLVEYDGQEYLLGVAGGSFTVIETRKLSEEERENRKEEQSKAPMETVPFAKYWEKFKENLGNKGVDKS